MTLLWRVQATVMPKEGVNDPQGEAIRNGLTSLEFRSVRAVRAGKLLAIEIEASSEQEAREEAGRMCDQLLANPVIEQYQLTVEPVSGRAESQDRA